MICSMKITIISTITIIIMIKNPAGSTFCWPSVSSLHPGAGFWSHQIQCLQSSLSQDGGANLRPHSSEKIQTTLKTWIGRPQLLPKIFKIELAHTRPQTLYALLAEFHHPLLVCHILCFSFGYHHDHQQQKCFHHHYLCCISEFWSQTKPLS